MMRKLTILLLLLSAAPPLAAETVVEITKTTVMGNDQLTDRELVSTQTITLGEGRARLDFFKTSLIYHDDAKRLYMIFHKSRTYFEIPMPLDLASLIDEAQQPMLAQLEQMQAADVEVEKTGETREIGTWDAELQRLDAVYPIFGGTAQVEAWIARDLEIDEHLFHSARALFETFDPGKAWLDELRRLDGIPVRIEQRGTTGSLKSAVEEITKITRDAVVPQDTFTVPESYRKTPFRLDHFLQIHG